MWMYDTVQRPSHPQSILYFTLWIIASWRKTTTAVLFTKLSPHNSTKLWSQSPGATEQTRQTLPSASSQKITIVVKSCAEPAWTKFTLDEFLSAVAREKDLFPQTECGRQIVAQLRGIFIEWRRKRGLPRGGKAYVTGICPLVPHHSGAPARLVPSLFCFRSGTSENVNEGIQDHFRLFNSIKLSQVNRTAVIQSIKSSFHVFRRCQLQSPNITMKAIRNVTFFCVNLLQWSLKLNIIRDTTLWCSSILHLS